MSDGGSGRAPRLPRWTRQEILVLIQGKRVVESRGRGANPVEPKWVAVSGYCKRHGVDRGAVQCRKRWSNLAGDFKKIKEWERVRGAKGGETFWALRNDARREQRLPGFFDREVFDILDGGAVREVEVVVGEEAAVFDSGRAAGEDGLFSDFEEEKDGGGDEDDDDDDEDTPATVIVAAVPVVAAAAAAVTPISEKKSEPIQQESSGPAKDKHPATENTEKASPSRETQKRRRTSQEGAGDPNLESQLIQVLERNNKVLSNHLEAQNVNYQLDRDQRRDQTDSLLGVLGKLADALGRIADKL